MSDEERQMEPAEIKTPQMTNGDEGAEHDEAVEPASTPAPTKHKQGTAFWNDGEKEEAYRSRWIRFQTEFVDDPSDSVRNADALVSEMIESISNSFLEERSSLEERWSDGGDPTTEDLRLSMTEYRDLFDRLMSVRR